MPECRKDPIVDRWLIIAEDRALRPNEFSREPAAESRVVDSAPTLECPFCPDQEDRTPPAVFERRGASGAWSVRVVPNKYPSVTPAATGGADSRHASGAHEVIIESRRHVLSVGQLGLAQFTEVVRAWRDRIAFWRADGSFSHPFLFKNVGRDAGASLTHAHSQLMILDRTPTALARELRATEAHFARTQSCIFCDYITREREEVLRVVLDENGFIAIAAYAGRQPFETWLLPTDHASDFDALADDALSRLAKSLYRLIVKTETVQARPAYNLILHTAPFDINAKDRYHWHVELIPRETQFAGFELGGEEFIHSVAPERAAVVLRAAAEKLGGSVKFSDSADE